MLANEAYRAGLGATTNIRYIKNYENEKDFTRLLSLTTEIKDVDDITRVTDLTDQLLTVAAENLSSRRQIELTAADLRRVVNLNLDTAAMKAMHNRTENLLHNHCTMNDVVTDTMYRIMDRLREREIERR